MIVAPLDQGIKTEWLLAQSPPWVLQCDLKGRLPPRGQAAGYIALDWPARGQPLGTIWRQGACAGGIVLGQLRL